MNGGIYTDIAEELRRLGGIDRIGVVTAPGESAIIYAGNKVLKKYFDGTKKQAVIFSVSAMDKIERQRELVEKLCGIGDVLSGSEPVIQGISQPTVKINSLPVPTMKNEHYYIYTSSVEITFYMKG